MSLILRSGYTYTVATAGEITNKPFTLSTDQATPADLARGTEQILATIRMYSVATLHDVRGIEIATPKALGIYVTEASADGIQRLFYDAREPHLSSYLHKKYPKAELISSHLLPSAWAEAKQLSQPQKKSSAERIYAKTSVLDPSLLLTLRAEMDALKKVDAAFKHLDSSHASRIAGVPADLRVRVNTLKALMQPIRGSSLIRSEERLFKQFYHLIRGLDKHRPNSESGVAVHAEISQSVNDPLPAAAFILPPKSNNLPGKPMKKTEQHLERLLETILAVDLTTAGTYSNKIALGKIEYLLNDHNLFDISIKTHLEDAGLTAYLYALKHGYDTDVHNLFFKVIKMSSHPALVFDKLVTAQHPTLRSWSAVMICAFYNTPEALLNLLAQSKNKSKLRTVVNRAVHHKTVMDYLAEQIPENELDQSRIMDNVKVLITHGAQVTNEMTKMAMVKHPQLAELLSEHETKTLISAAAAAGRSEPTLFNTHKRKFTASAEGLAAANSASSDVSERQTSDDPAAKKRMPAK